ncbi:DNA-binding response regulator [Paenibacillus ihbetae]|uniref:DNA-binding response regulator n=1 Tax=Paenibacillus ihbetae TaxID=1870820 RepID=A0A1B2DYT6_9BACL|nr:response regulator transcription factor [Paenibacillus ihbetae]ANY72885.1 DNA-binding response regulator [Paenibacillus ihbetae]
METKKILIIEDEPSISDMLAFSMRKEGYGVKTAESGREGLELFTRWKPDLLLLDLMLPDMTGFDVCRQVLEASNTPIIMLTARTDTFDRILGIESGADDYITKPFDIREVIVRIKAVFRRIELTAEAVEHMSSQVLNLGYGITLEKEKREVRKNGVPVVLTQKEYELLQCFAEHKGRVFSRSELLDKVWGFEVVIDTRTVDIHVQRIRKKLDEPNRPSLIETVFGIGYKLVQQG